jgi:DNA polymerase-3 subunit delta
LVEYVSKPSPTTVLILVANEKFDARTRFYKALEKHGATLRFMHPTEREMPQVVKARAKAIGVAIDEQAVRLLVESVGADVAAATQALEKLVLFVGPGQKRPISAADVETVVSSAREESIFALSDAIGRGDLAEALRGLHNLITVGHAHPLALLGLIARHWRKLLIARSMLDAGAPTGQIQAALQVPPFAADKMLSQARRQRVASLTKGLSAITEADHALKGGKLEGERVMERLVLVLSRVRT